MERRLRKTVRSWLKAEGAGDAIRAEAALRAVFLRLPAYAPARDFVDRVLLRVGIRPDSLASRPRLALQLKLALGLCYVLVAVALIWLPAVLSGLWSGPAPSLLIGTLTGLLVSLTELWSQGIIAWQALDGLSRSLAGSLASPTVFAAMAVSILISAIALRLLHGLLVSDRNARHAQLG